MHLSPSSPLLCTTFLLLFLFSTSTSALAHQGPAAAASAPTFAAAQAPFGFILDSEELDRTIQMSREKAAAKAAAQAATSTPAVVADAEQNPASRQIIGQDVLWAVVLGGAVVFAGLI